MNAPRSYSDFLDYARQVTIDNVEDEHWENQIQRGKYYKFYRDAMPGIYVLDFTKQRYVYCNDVMASYADQPIADLMQSGLSLALKLWHPDDLKVYDQYILPVNMQFLKDKSAHDYGNFLFTCNYRVKQRRGHYRHVEQTSFFSKSYEGSLPMMTIGFLRDITSRSLDNHITHTIEDITSSPSKLSFKKTYNPNATKSILTLREVQILELIVKGKNSHEIAFVLGIDKYTVDNHRKNMLRKTHAENMIQLAVWACGENLITSRGVISF